MYDSEVMDGKEFNINVVREKIQISFFVGSAMTVKSTLEGHETLIEGWDIKSDIF